MSDPVSLGTASSTSTVTSLQITLTAGIASGDTVGVAIVTGSTLASAVSVTDDGSNTYSADQAYNSNGVAVFKSHATHTVSSGGKITISFTGGTSAANAIAWKQAGVSVSLDGSVDDSGTLAGNVTESTSESVVNGDTNVVVVAVFGSESSGAATVDSPYTLVDQSRTTSRGLLVAYYDATATGSQTFTSHWAQGHATQILGFNYAVSSSTTVTPTAVAGSAAVPSATITTRLDATVTPSVVHATASANDPTVIASGVPFSLGAPGITAGDVSISITTDVGLLPHNTALVALTFGGTTPTGLAVSDNAGNTYTALYALDGNVAIYGCVDNKNMPAGTVITASWSGSTACTMCADAGIGALTLAATTSSGVISGNVQLRSMSVPETKHALEYGVAASFGTQTITGTTVAAPYTALTYGIGSTSRNLVTAYNQPDTSGTETFAITWHAGHAGELVVLTLVTVAAVTVTPDTVSAVGSIPAATVGVTVTPDVVAAVAAVNDATVTSTASATSIVKVQDWAASTSGTAALPNTPVEGNLLLLAVSSDTTVPTPSGWAKTASLVNVIGLYLFTKTAGASEPSSVALGVSNAAAAMCEVAAADTFEDLTGSVTRSTGSAPVVVSLTGVTTQTDELILTVAGSTSASALQWDGWASGFVEQIDITTANTTEISLAVAEQTQTGEAQWSTSAQTFNRSDGTLAAAQAEALIVALKADPNSATVRPAVTHAAATLPAATVDVSIDKTVTPSVVHAVTAAATPGLSTPGFTVVAPATVSALAAVGEPVRSVTSATLTPPAVQAAGEVPFPGGAGTVTITAVPVATVSGTATLGTPSVSTTSAVDATVKPVAVHAPAAVPTAGLSAGASVTVTPAVLRAVTAITTASVVGTDVSVAALTVMAVAQATAALIATTVPTYKFVPPVTQSWPVVSADRHPMNRLMRHSQPTPMGTSVWVTTDGQYTTQQPVYWEQVDHVFYGGHEYIVSAEEAAKLQAAGFTVEAAS